MHALGMSKSSFFGLHLVPTAAVLKVGSRLAQGWFKAACSSLEPAWLKAACSNPEPFAQGCAGPSHEISSTVFLVLHQVEVLLLQVSVLCRDPAPEAARNTLQSLPLLLSKPTLQPTF